MSSLRKSASFRSRIPVRRIKPRRCYSPQPPSTTAKATTKASIATSRDQQHNQQQPANVRKTTIGRRSVWPDSNRYSSSSCSSSDESEDSDIPPQNFLLQVAHRPYRNLHASTDAMSLNGLLDAVSCGSLSSGTGNFLGTTMLKPETYSSYDSLDKYQCETETLKLTTDLRKCTQPHTLTERTNTDYSSHSIQPQPQQLRQLQCSLITRAQHRHEQNQRHNDDVLMQNDNSPQASTNKELEKQRQLSDWYYIKSSPTKSKHQQSSPPFLPPRPPPKRNVSRADATTMTECGKSRPGFLRANRKSSEVSFKSTNNNNVRTERDDSKNNFAGLIIANNTTNFKEIEQNNMETMPTTVAMVVTAAADKVACKSPANGRVDGAKANDCVKPEQRTPVSQQEPQNKQVMSKGRFIRRQHIDGNVVGGCAGDSSVGGSGASGGNGCGGSAPAVAADGKAQMARKQFNAKHKSNLNNVRFGGGEVSSSSFEHVNCSSFVSEMTVPEKPFKSTNNGVGAGKYIWKPENDEHLVLYPPKPTSYHSECELSGSYVSLECPSPPGPPACLTDSRRDPQTRLHSYLKVLYTDLALKEPVIPQWAQPTAPGALCPARLEPDLRLHPQSHGVNECISVDQLLTSIQTKDGPFFEAPRRLLIECPTWSARHSLGLRILHAWAKEPPWPQRGTPVALALFIPLPELKKGFANYVEKELISKGPNNPFATGFGGFSAAWNSLVSLGPKLLIVLDGFDNPRGSPKRKSKSMPPDVLDLLEGKLFPESRVIIISVTHNNNDIFPLMQRHVKYEGLTWGRSASLLGGGQWGAPTRLLDTVQSCVHLRNIARTPLGCLALASVYETTGGDMPTDEIDVIESIVNCVSSESSANNISELGRLALFCLKTKRSTVTTTEIRMYCSYPDDKILGCLDKAPLFGRTAKKKFENIYTPICPGVSEFLAANYLASLANRPGLLAAEITGLSLGDEVEPDILKVLTFSMGLLAGRAHILLSKLTPLWLSPQTVFSLALAGGDSTANLNALCDLLGISKTPPISPLEANPIWVQIRSTPNELLGWAMALKSSSCTLKNLELNYQLDKHMVLDSRSGIDIFLDALSVNESVSTLRISSLIEMDVKEADISIIANCVSRALLKPRLENFELILTLLEEDPPVLKLQTVVTALCRSLPRQTRLGSLLLDLGLCTSQLVQICSTLEKCAHVTRLSLPHLRCERGAIGALASLLSVRPLSSLALPSCWGARDDPPSSSGVSMGSGSGSSTGTSGLIKQSSLTGAPSPRSYPTGIFSSLPRGVIVPTTMMGRSATLPRQPLDCPPDKRSSDSVVSKTWYPTPACDGGPHNSGTLHDLLLTAREPQSRLYGLDLSKAQLSLEDSMCLGETVRVSSTLHSLKMEGASRLSEILPSVLGAGESQCLQMMILSSPRLALEDGATAMAARSLANCVTLRLLSLEGWSFRIENWSTLAAVRAFLTFTSVRELGLSNCRLHLPSTKLESVPPQTYECRSIVVLKLAGAQVLLNDNNSLRGPQLIAYLGGFPSLREIDLSAPARSGLGSSTSTTPFILDDKCIVTFFQSLHSHFGMLNTLKMCNWILHLDDSGKTLRTVSKCLRNSPLSHVKIDGISVLDRPKKTRIEPLFLHAMLSSLPGLRWFGISLAGKKDDQIMAIGNSVLELRGYEIDIRLSDSSIESARLLAQTIGLDGKFDIRVSTFGTSSGILVHAEKTGTKSLSRKQ